MNTLPVIIRPEWLQTAKDMLVTKKSNKEYAHFMVLLGELILRNDVDLNDGTKAGKLLNSLRIQEKIDADLTRYEKKCRRKTFDSDGQKADLQETNFGNSNSKYNSNSISNNKEQNAIANTDADMQAGNAAMQSSMERFAAIQEKALDVDDLF